MTAKIAASADGLSGSIAVGANEAFAFKPVAGGLELSQDGITFQTVDTNGVVAFPQTPNGGGIRGFFQAKVNVDQNITSAVLTKVNFTETIDQDNWLTSSSGSIYTPQIAGYYQFFVNLWLSASRNITGHQVFFYKNGVTTNQGCFKYDAAGSGKIVSVTAVIYLNGTTDYIEIYAAATGTSPQVLADGSSFSGSLLYAG